MRCAREDGEELEIGRIGSGWIDGLVGGCMDEYMGGWMDGWVGAWLRESKGGRTGAWMDGWLNT